MKLGFFILSVSVCWNASLLAARDRADALILVEVPESKRVGATFLETKAGEVVSSLEEAKFRIANSEVDIPKGVVEKVKQNLDDLRKKVPDYYAALDSQLHSSVVEKYQGRPISFWFVKRTKGFRHMFMFRSTMLSYAKSIALLFEDSFRQLNDTDFGDDSRDFQTQLDHIKQPILKARIDFEGMTQNFSYYQGCFF